MSCFLPQSCSPLHFTRSAQPAARIVSFPHHLGDQDEPEEASSAVDEHEDSAAGDGSRTASKPASNGVALSADEENGDDTRKVRTPRHGTGR